MKEHRTEVRQHTLKAAKIVIDSKSIIDCTVRDLSSKGACLEVTSPIGIPETFELTIPVDSLTHKCRVSWRKTKRIGVYFV